MKTKETNEIEDRLFINLSKNGQFNVFECTLGFGGGGRVDCISIDTKNTVRCFEIKVTKSDFHSKHGHNFKGNLNYYVMPQKLYNEVKNEVPKYIGVYDEYINCIKKAKRKEIDNLEVIKSYIIRSLYREYVNNRNSESKAQMKYITAQMNRYKNDYLKINSKYIKLVSKIMLKYGRKEYKDLIMEDI